MNTLLPDAIVDNLHRLPSLPNIVSELIIALNQEGVSIGALAQGIEKDQALSARALRVANSPFYGLRQPIASINDAIVVLGFRAVSSLVMTAALTDLFKMPYMSWFDQATFWRHSLGTAVCARKLARIAGLEPETGFTAGLLHDIGRLLLVMTSPKQYEAANAYRNEEDCSLTEAERHVLGITHAEAGEALAKHWHFAPVIRDAVACHHAPPPAGKATITDLTHVSNILAHALDIERAPRSRVDTIDPDAWARLNLDWSKLRGLLPEIEHEFESYDSLLPQN